MTLRAEARLSAVAMLRSMNAVTASSAVDLLALLGERGIPTDVSIDTLSELASLKVIEREGDRAYLTEDGARDIAI